MSSTTKASSAPRKGGLPVALCERDPSMRRQMRALLESAGYRPVEMETEAALLAPRSDQLAVLSLNLSARSGPPAARLETLRRVRSRLPQLPVVAVTAREEMEIAVEAMRLGVDDCVPEPIERERYLESIGRAAQRTAGSPHKPQLLGRSQPMAELQQQLERVRASDVAVHLHGESGTGKELVARAVHDNSRRRSGPFVALNCASIPASLQESDLFGHEKGAFTGAVCLHRGRLEQAHGGTLFLDEIAEMSHTTQASLLRALQERSIRRVGGTTDIPVDLRIVSATHRDLRAEVMAGRFREDLYFRLVVFPIELPPLRERATDIPLLAEHLLATLDAGERERPQRIGAEALAALGRHRWPGNVRELQNVLQRALLACDGDEIGLEHLPKELRSLAQLPAPAPQPSAAAAGAHEPVLPMREVERRAIERALKVAQGNISEAARLLALSRATLYRRMHEFSIQGSEQSEAR